MQEYAESIEIKYQLGLTQQLLDITNRILSENVNDNTWIKKLLDWGNKHINKDDALFPRTEDEIIESKSISLRWNRLVSIPAELFKLKQLKVLELNNNNLTNLPVEIARLENLEELNLNINNLTKLPAEITQLKNLKALNIKNNKYLELSSSQINWLNNLLDNGCIVIYDKYKFNLGV